MPKGISTFQERKDYLIQIMHTSPHISYKQAHRKLVRQFGMGLGAMEMSHIIRENRPVKLPVTEYINEPGCKDPESILKAIKEVYGKAAEVRVQPDGTIFLFF